MWARIIEIMLGLWLALSPFVLPIPPGESFFKINNSICAILVILFACLSFRKKISKTHLLTIAVSLWLWGLGYSTFPEKTSVQLENSVIVGLLLLMLAIVPSHAEQLSPSWQKFIKKK